MQFQVLSHRVIRSRLNYNYIRWFISEENRLLHIYNILVQGSLKKIEYCYWVKKNCQPTILIDQIEKISYVCSRVCSR